ncbi:YheC/YheD family protein [Paenibacillus sp. y28]|uniref:YheC/YheD family protein n=1 Tax=Paenibacillus sp. y28 TaxID=3129110 RepID=UPI00301AC88B
MKRAVGILLDASMYHGIPRKKTGYERISLYNRAAKQLGLKPYYMTLAQINHTSAQSFTYSGGRYAKVKHQIPPVIHNRAFTATAQLRQRLTSLAKKSVVFNRKNRFSKYEINRLLSGNDRLRSYVPATWKYSRGKLAQVLKNRTPLFIKPASGSVGDGIFKIENAPGGKYLIRGKQGKPLHKTLQQTLACMDRMIRGRSYIIQEAIPLATHQGRPYDLRVSVQRGPLGSWQVTGMVGKVAAAGKHVTNVAKGGKVKPCAKLFQGSGFSEKAVTREVKQASLKIAAFLGKKLPHLADIGLDMGVEKGGAVKFIEMNGRDQRITFQKAGLEKAFYQTYLTPLRYAHFLMSGKKRRG